MIGRHGPIVHGSALGDQGRTSSLTATRTPTAISPARPGHPVDQPTTRVGGAYRARMDEAVEPEALMEHIGPGADLIVPLANGEPVALLDTIEAHAGRLEGVRVHQMHALHDRPYLHGAFGDRLRHVSYFLSHVTRPCFRAGTVDLVPNHFSEMRNILMRAHRRPAGHRGRVTAGPARLLQPRGQRRLRVVVHRAGPHVPRGERADAAHVRSQPGPRQPGVGLDARRSAVARGRSAGAQHDSTSASPRSSPSGSPTGPRSRPASGRSPTPSSRRSRGTGTSGCTRS